MKRHWVYFTLLVLILSACQYPPPPTSPIFTQIPEGLDTPYMPTRTPTNTSQPPTPSPTNSEPIVTSTVITRATTTRTEAITPNPTIPPTGIFAIKFNPPLVLDYPTDQWIDKSEYNNTEMMVNYLQNNELKTCTITPMGASGFYPDNMQEINLGSIRYQILLNQNLINGNVVNYYFALISYKGSGESEAGIPHFAVQSNATESEQCRTAAEEVLATLRRAD